MKQPYTPNRSPDPVPDVPRHWSEKGFSCAVWRDPPGQVWADFVHPVDELVMLIQGDMALSFNGKTLRPAVGEEILIPAQVPHTVRNIGPTTSRWYYGYRRRT